jgi:formylmethanofuran dehydrogenase subunit E
MDPFLIAFLLGVGIGFIEDDCIICPHCGCEFPEEDTRYVDGQCACPACLEPLQEE